MLALSIRAKPRAGRRKKESPHDCATGTYFPAREDGGANTAALETIEVLEQALARLQASLRQNGLRRPAETAAAVEYDSWSASLH